MNEKNKTEEQVVEIKKETYTINYRFLDEKGRSENKLRYHNVKAVSKKDAEDEFYIQIVTDNIITSSRLLATKQITMDKIFELSNGSYEVCGVYLVN